MSLVPMIPGPSFESEHHRWSFWLICLWRIFESSAMPVRSNAALPRGYSILSVRIVPQLPTPENRLPERLSLQHLLFRRSRIGNPQMFMA